VGKAPLVIASWYNGPWIKRAAERYDGWVASGLNSTFAELREGIKRYRDHGGKRAMVATVGVNFTATSPKLTDNTNFTLRCPLDEARERVQRLAELGFDDLLLTSGTNFAPQDLTKETLHEIMTLRPEAGAAASAAPAATAEAPHERAQDPVCRRFIDLTTMSSPTSRTIFNREYAGKTYYLCSDSCAEAFEKAPGNYLRA
jgi:YHS domain-containing protein